MSEDVWGLGAYERVAMRLRPVPLTLVDVAHVGPGDRVVDLGAGTGSASVAAARRGAVVTAVDASPALIAKGQETCCDGVEITWLLGDFNNVDAPDGAFDVVLSSLGVIYAVDPSVAIAECSRLCAPGGTIALATWPESSFQAAAEIALRSAVDAEPARSPWSSPARIADLLGPHVTTLQFSEVTFDWWFSSVEAWYAEAARDAPPLVDLLSTADQATAERVRQAVLHRIEPFTTELGTGVLMAQRALLTVAQRR